MISFPGIFHLIGFKVFGSQAQWGCICCDMEGRGVDAAKIALKSNTKCNILGVSGEDEKEQFKKMARHVLELSDEQLNGLIAGGKLEEIKSDDEEISK